jgi:uncharacterized protein DUF4126
MFAGEHLAALLLTVSFAAGLNLYATIGTLGILGHFHVLQLPIGLKGLDNWWIIGLSLALFVVEFFADKIPAFDLVWNALHTFVRVPAAAVLAYKATANLSPEQQALAAVAGGLIALASHGAKTAARAAVTPSPEPFSNIALSTGEDLIAIALTWLATQHPYAAAALVVVALGIIVVLVRWIYRSLRTMFRSAGQVLGGHSQAQGESS